ERALNTLRSAERPLVIVGKGMAYSRAEDEVRAFIERTKVPFLASPMGKGVMSDSHPLSVGAARSHALQNADVVFLMGARLNWIMHFGLPPRFNKNVRIIQLDVAPESIGQNAPAEVALVGDGKAIVAQINEALGMGFVIAAAVVHPDQPIISVSGDSAIGFSGMEMETVCRYQLPVKIVVFNNGGIGPGHATHPDNPLQNLKPNALIYGARYDKMM